MSIKCEMSNHNKHNNTLTMDNLFSAVGTTCIVRVSL